MGYMVRLGLWGAGTSFIDFRDFLSVFSCLLSHAMHNCAIFIFILYLLNIQLSYLSKKKTKTLLSPFSPLRTFFRVLTKLNFQQVPSS